MNTENILKQNKLFRIIIINLLVTITIFSNISFNNILALKDFQSNELVIKPYANIDDNEFSKIILLDITSFDSKSRINNMISMVNTESKQQEKPLFYDGNISSNNISSSNLTSLVSSFSFNPDVPVSIPLIEGYYNGTKVFFIHTEVSDKNMADMMTKMINFPTLYTPELNNIPIENTSKVYIFTNGIPGNGPYGGGPFMYQIDVFDSIPTQKEYSQFVLPYLVTWKEDSTPRILKSIEDIINAQNNDEITITNTPNQIIINAPIIAWKNKYNDTISPSLELYEIYKNLSDYKTNLTFIDTDNYITRLTFIHTDKYLLNNN